MPEITTLLQELNTTLVIIERSSGFVLAHEGQLPLGRGGFEGRDWRDALGVPPDCTAVISQAIKAGVAAPLPPIIVASSGDENILVGGMVVPETWRGKEVVSLLLRRLNMNNRLLPDEELIDNGVVAVLGLDRLEFSPGWGAAETERLMMDLRSGLKQIVRDEDWVGLPSGATIALVFCGLEPEAALDVSRALLSHLHQRLARQTGGAQYARACIGLSQALEGQGAISALLSANTALLQAQAGGEERIRFSSPWDPQGLAARALNNTGAFRDAAEDSSATHYLHQLTEAELEQLPPEQGLAKFLDLSLQQPGFLAIALVRLDYHEEFSALVAAENRAGSWARLPAGKLPQGFQGALRRCRPQDMETGDQVELPDQKLVVFPLRINGVVWGGLVVQPEPDSEPGFCPSPATLQYLGSALGARLGAPGAAGAVKSEEAPVVRQMEKGIEGYVLDNMEGAIDQAVFLASIDMPIAIIGASGTGKMYIAQVIHNEATELSGSLEKIDCRSFRNRSEAYERLLQALKQGEGKTLVFKSLQLVHQDVQLRLARILATRTVTDEQGSHYLPAARYIALFPQDIASLVSRGELEERLASVFSGYPIQVPPLRDRSRAVLRWAHKILEQEASQSDRRVQGFTADAEQAMLQHPWPGNISEMRNMIRAALERTDKDWITPVDLGIFSGISADGSAARAEQRPFLALLQESAEEPEEYAPSALDELRVAMAQALAAVLETGMLRPLGAWLDDEIVLAATQRYGSDGRGVAEFLHTRSRNIGRWMPKIQERQAERNASLLWQETGELVHRWISDTPPLDTPPQQFAQEILLGLVLQQCDGVSVADRAKIMGVSTPTYQKRLKQILREA